MDAYVFQAALYCESCGEAIKERLDAAGTENTGDSNDYPQGPYPDGGGEADSPQHCDSSAHCLNAEEITENDETRKIGAFLENPLTSDGVKYVQEQTRKRPISRVVRMWLAYYGIKPIPRGYTIKWSDRETTIKADRIACNQIDLSARPSVRLWAVANEYGILGLVWADNIQDALDALVNEDLGAALLMDSKTLQNMSEDEIQDLATLGNADEYADLTYAGAWPVDLTPELVEAFRRAADEGCGTLADLD